MPSQLHEAFINLFADDTLIYLHGKNIDVMRDQMNREMERISQWLRRNKLKLNVNKTKLMVIKGSSVSTSTKSVTVDGEEIEMVKEFKYLGVMIDEKLSLKANVDYLCKKVSKKVGVLCRLAKFITMAARVSIYKAIIAPHFDYCATLLYQCDEGSFDRMQKLQNRAMRAILMCKKRTPVRTMLQNLNMLNVRQRVRETTLKFIHKLKTGRLPGYLREMVQLKSDVHKYPTRSRNDFRVCKRKTQQAYNSVLNRGLIEFNSLPSEVKDEICGEIFKFKLKSYLREMTTV